MREHTQHQSAPRDIFVSGQPANGNGNAKCSVPGCSNRPLVAVACDGRSLTMMCLHHAIDWTDSGVCRDAAQYDGTGYLGYLAGWLATRA